jgi:Ankyrin repeat
MMRFLALAVLLFGLQSPSNQPAPGPAAVSHRAPICVATGRGDLELVRHMLEEKPALPSPILHQCLVSAARSGNVELLNLWLDYGAKPVPALAQQKPLKAMVGEDNAGEERDARDAISVLQAGIDSGSPAVVAKLLEFPFDLHLNAFGLYEPVLVYALGDGASRDEAKNVPPADRLEIVKMLLEHGADPNAADVTGHTALFETQYRPDVVKVLVSAGAKVNSRDQDLRTPLLYSTDDESVVRALLAAGADPTLADDEGHTALSEAKAFKCDGCITLIEAAIEQHKQGAP